MRTIFALILTSIAFVSCYSQGTGLYLKLEKGKEYRQVSISKANVSQEANGQNINMVMTIKGTITFLVKSETENGYVMDTEFENLGMSVQMPGGSLEYSSEKIDDNDIFSKVLGSMTNKAFEVTMSKAGKVIEIKNIEVLWENAINQFDQLSEPQKEQIKAQIIKSYGADAFKGNIEMVTAIYPDKPVNKGDKWTINTNLESGMSAKISTDYEYDDLTPEYALIKGISTIETADKEAYIKTNNMPLKYDLKGSMLSEIKVDRNSGWIIEAKINQEIKGDAYIEENPDLPEGMKIPMIMTSEMIITD